MSDGPHKSLPMRPGWKKFAERAAKAAFEPDQVADAAAPALEGDWNEEVAPHIAAVRNLLGDKKQGSLPFGDQNTAELEALRRINPGNTLWRAVIDGVADAVVNGLAGTDALVSGVTSALLDRGARGIRQVEEHYLRRTDESRAVRVRTRMEQGISSTPIAGLARRLCGLDPVHAAVQPRKLEGLDDGVRF